MARRASLRPRNILLLLRPKVAVRIALLLALLAPLKHSKHKTKLSKSDQNHVVTALRQLLPPPTRLELGGETIDDEAYARFLAVHDWDVHKTAPVLAADFAWRRRLRPHALRPWHCREACSQKAWRVLFQQPRAGSRWRVSSGAAVAAHDDDDHHHHHEAHGETAAHAADEEERSLSTDFRSVRRRLAAIAKRRRIEPTVLHPPHIRPRLAQWRYTRHGMPITHVDVRQWHPERYSDRREVTRHCAYHMEHYVRRMPVRGGRQVQRCCIIMSLKGFRPSCIAHVCECIQILRLHYPGRLGVAVLYNVPSYFWPLWPIFKKLFDEEIMSKVHFMPPSIHDVDSVVKWIDKQNLPPFADLSTLV